MFAKSNDLNGTFIGCYIKIRTVMVAIFTMISITLTYLFLYILTKQSEGLTTNEQDWMTFFMFVHFFLVTRTV